MIRPALAAVALIAGVTVVAAQQDPIKTRQELMKSNGAEAKAGAAMAKGEAPFDLVKAKEIFTTFDANAEKLQPLWPAGSDKGDTKASPKIWSDMAGFNTEFTRFETLAKTAQTSVTDLASFKTQFSAVDKACGDCHQTYRLKKS